MVKTFAKAGERMRAEDLLAAIEVGTLKFRGITHDSRKVEEGFVFVALTGKIQDGHDYIQEAMRRGAACLVCQRPTASPLPTYLTDSPRYWLARLAAAIYGHPSAKQHVIGVTGSNGKTTIAAMLHSFFGANAIPCGMIGTVENDINGLRVPATLTTPEAPDLQRMLSELAAAGTRHVVMEVSAQGVDMERIVETNFSIGIFTNITPDHLDFHRSMEDYIESKKLFMNSLPSDKIGIYNWDDPIVRQAGSECRCKRFTYSLLDSTADLSLHTCEAFPSGSRFSVKVGARLKSYTGPLLESILFHIELPGMHNVSNALAALSAGIVSGLDPWHMMRALKSFRAVTRRMETFNWNGIVIVDDTAMNPGSITAVLGSFCPEQYKRVHLVFAIRGNRGIEVNRENARVLANWHARWKQKQPTVVVTSSVSHVGPNDQVSADEQSAFLETLWEHGVPFVFYPDLPEAIEHVSDCACAGELVYLLGAQGMDDGFRILSQTRKIKDLVN